MESKIEDTQECSLKIDTIWSEADESLLIKEEIVSDLEPDSAIIPQENVSSSTEHHSDTQVEEEGNSSSHPENQLVPSWQHLKKKVKTRSQRTEETEIINNKLSCLHDPKNFKIVKRRLRCGECRSLVCPECCKVMIPNLQSHFLGSGMCNSGTYLCKLCSIIFHSLCALQAHIRIHTMDTPYVCPDCGLIYNNIYFLILHLLNKCYHVYKIVRYKCKQCPGAYFTPDNFVQHIQETHIHCVFRCLYCSSLFNNCDEFNFHMENHHQKQKVQYLNYFRCSLCSNMVIPRFMYQRHVSQHRENSEFYEVDYQCLCGESYGLIGAFRSHFSYCSQKGVLPPKWSFLQRKLRSQDMIPSENFQSKEVHIQTLPVFSSDSDYKKLTLVRTVSKNGTTSDEIIKNRDISAIIDCDGFDEATMKSLKSETDKNQCNKENDQVEKTSESCNNNNNNNNNNNYLSLGNSSNKNKAPEDSTAFENSDNSKTGMNEGTNVSSEGGQCSRDGSKESATSDTKKNSEENQNSKQADGGDMSNIYDHIPCDHLGYVIKTQCPESHKKTGEGEDVILEKSFSPRNYRFVTELDEKTGIITTRSVPLDELEMDEDDNTNDDDYDLESLNFSTASKQFNNEKAKLKSNNSLCCPFCVVLFPKHNLTFQQFRLHLESYHPDAGLNITINNVCESAPDKDSTENSNVVEEESNINNSKLVSTGNSIIEYPFNNFSNMDNCEKESTPEQNQSGVDQYSFLKTVVNESNEKEQTETGAVSNKRLLDDDNENCGGDENKIFKSTIGSVGENEKILNEVLDGKDESRGWEDFGMEKESPRVDLNSANVDEDKEKSEIPKEVNNKEHVNGENKTGDDFVENFRGDTGNTGEARNGGNTPEKQNCQESMGRMSPKTVSDLDYEGETSKDSNWSGTSGKDTRVNSPSDSKVEEGERSRRESEVWSEFYESLMLAEKLKKRKNPSPDSDGKKKSVVSDYSSKRVVKKPKRYRESSDSADSNEYSESDEDLLVENDFMEKITSEEKNGTEDQPNKKQMLLDKLENVDGKFVDYLFDLVTKKEKLFELYKKHSTLRANRYSHDLRSYRKKVLNGIKQRGRPLKILRYHELLKKKELSGEKNGKESYQLKKKSDFSPDNKSNEKKRGRPRKYHEAGKLKERRRSDKEVDFIEKNFERDEIDLSPSKRKRKLSSKLQYYKKMSDEREDFSSGQVITNKPLDSNKKFTCAVCKEVFPGLTEFRVHIVAHRMEENTYQCMECGECFVVRPSLEKHLHAFHKIKNTEKYILDNQCCSIKKEIVEADDEPLKENQCKVCKDQFDRPIDLTKHFRIHGMAFLKEFRKEGKSSEKRNV